MDTYKAAGVDYDVLDAGKRTALGAALATSYLLQARGARGYDASRGESAFVFEVGGEALAIVLECLGTKSVIAREYQELTGENRFAEIAIDTIGSIVNDIICVGALPLVINAYFATGSPDWYSVSGRFDALVEGWKRGCEASGAAWGGGESPGLSGLVHERDIDLAGCAVGRIPPGNHPLLGEELSPGDEIVLVASSGMHANGASLVRKIAGELPDGYMTALPSGDSLGEAVLLPSVLYVKLIEALQKATIPLTYLSHITGHGFRKLMRPTRELTYRISHLLPVPEVLSFLAGHASMTTADAYGTFNMGAGFAIFCRPGNANTVVSTSESLGYKAAVAGVVEEGPRRVIIEPLAITYNQQDLQLR